MIKKFFAVVLLIVSGIGLFIPDPLPFIDEGMALMIFLNSLAFLGLDVRRLFGVKGGKSVKSKKEEHDQTIDV